MCVAIPGKPKSKRRRHRSQSGRHSDSGRDQSSRGQSLYDRPPPRNGTPWRGQECHLTEGRENPRNRERSGRRETRKYHSPSPEPSPSPPPRRASRASHVSRGRIDDREYHEAPYRQGSIDTEPPVTYTGRLHRYNGSDPNVIFVTDEG